MPRARHDPGLRRVLPRVRVGAPSRSRVLAPRRLRRLATRASSRVHSLSKRSNLAGYRCAFVAGDPAIVGELLAVRKNLGLQMPGPQQRAMIAALDDDAHVADAARAVRRPTGRRCRTALEGAASASTTPRPRSTSGHSATDGGPRTAGRRSAGWPTRASSWRPVTSTVRRARTTCASPSPRPTSGSLRQSPGSPDQSMTSLSTSVGDVTQHFSRQRRRGRGRGARGSPGRRPTTTGRGSRATRCRSVSRPSRCGRRRSRVLISSRSALATR